MRGKARRRLAVAALRSAVLGALLSAPGCFDGEAIIENHRKEASRSKLSEVDLGVYRIALPRTPGDMNGGVVEFHVFGQVTNENREALLAQVEAESPELKHRMLLAIRELKLDDLEDPQLAKLRESVAEVFNRALANSLVQSVGFYDFTFGRY